MATSAAALQWMAPNQMRAPGDSFVFGFHEPVLALPLGLQPDCLIDRLICLKDEQLVGYSMVIVACAAALIAVVLMARGFCASRKP